MTATATPRDSTPRDAPRPQGFRTKEEVQRFADIMEEMCHIVANKHGGSLKGEHGTGR